MLAVKEPTLNQHHLIRVSVLVKTEWLRWITAGVTLL